MSRIDDKRIFLIASDVPKRIEQYSEFVSKHIANSLIFTSTDGLDVLSKLENCPPAVLVIDPHLPRKSSLDVVAHILKSEKLKSTNVVVASTVPDAESFVNEVVTGQVQILADPESETRFLQCVVKALNRVSYGTQNEYVLRFLAPDEILFREGEIAQSVFIVRRGELKAVKTGPNGETVLGLVRMGEFVGEMAHINDEPRSATVVAVSDCELIEIPRGSLDTVLFTKPAWAKALVTNLSKRLKTSNEALAKF